ncbi:endothelin-converting enzyme 2-like isoform X2 [Dermacentor albipictus]|uniref:endothelin-converting enzyme 2-like isoform X2 n=1 Tax=Dermacentor albipictus TaxID=60249 RepID=UPI0038FCFCEB
MSMKASRQGRVRGPKKLDSRPEHPPATASDFELDGGGHSSDRDSDQASRTSNLTRTAQQAAKPPRLRRRRSSSFVAPPKPNESPSQDPSSISRRRQAGRKHRRTSARVSRHLPDDQEPETAPFVAVSATDAAATDRVPGQPGEQRLGEGPVNLSETTPSQATPSSASTSTTQTTSKEEPAESTPGMAATVDAPVSSGRRPHSGGTHGRPLAEGPVPGAPHNGGTLAKPVRSSSAPVPSTSKEPADTAEASARTVSAQPPRSTLSRATLGFTSARGSHDISAGPRRLTELHRLEDLLEVPPETGKQDAVRPWTNRILLSVAALLVVILTLVVFALYRVRKVNGEEHDLCSTLDCIEHVRALNIDTGRSPPPCEDFAGFICPGWTDTYRHVNGSVREQVVLEWIATIEKLSLSDFDRQAVINRPLSMMRKCMATASDGDNAMRMMIAFVSERSFAWPTQNDTERIVDYGRALKVILELSVVWALPLWFRVRLLPAAASAHLQRDRAIVLSPSTPPLLWHFIHQAISKYEDAYSIYTGFFMNTLFELRPLSESFAIFLKNRSAAVQAQVFRELTAAFYAPNSHPRLVEIRTLPKLVRELNANDWVRALGSVYGVGANITASDLVLATNDGLIKATRAIFSSNTAQDIFFHTIWWFVQSVGAMVNTRLLVSMGSIPEGAYFRRLLCFHEVDTTYNALLASINKAMLSTSERLAITSRLDKIRSVAVEKLRAYSKLSAETRQALAAAVESMSTVIWPEDDFGRPGGFEQYYGEPYRSGEGGFYGEWEWSRWQMYNRSAKAAGGEYYVAASEAFSIEAPTLTTYNPVRNVISIGVAALSPPFYYRDATSAVFYAGLGFLYADGIFRAVNAMAHLLNGSGSMNPTDSAVTTSEFQNASCCADSSEDSITFPHLSALDVAYTAYTRFRDEASDLRLKGLPQYSPAQVFFATFCHCTCWTNDFKKKYSLVCYNAVKNFDPFAQAFSCPA